MFATRHISVVGAYPILRTSPPLSEVFHRRDEAEHGCPSSVYTKLTVSYLPGKVTHTFWASHATCVTSPLLLSNVCILRKQIGIDRLASTLWTVFVGITFGGIWPERFSRLVSGTTSSWPSSETVSWRKVLFLFFLITFLAYSVPYLSLIHIWRCRRRG